LELLFLFVGWVIAGALIVRLAFVGFAVVFGLNRKGRAFRLAQGLAMLFVVIVTAAVITKFMTFSLSF